MTFSGFRFFTKALFWFVKFKQMLINSEDMKLQNNEEKKLARTIENKERRKLKQKRKAKHPILKGLGMFGLIGWTVTAPTLLGTFVGIWLDDHYPSKRSWTLTFLITGLILGCIGAWYWLSKEKNDIQKDEDDLND